VAADRIQAQARTRTGCRVSDLPAVKLHEGLLHCPACDSMDLRMTETTDVLACDDCGAKCARHDDQCPQCGERGMTQTEVTAFPAPGQAPSQAPSRMVRRCDHCGYTNAHR